LALGSVDARAAAYEITWDSVTPSPVTGDNVTFHAARVKGNGGQDDTFGWMFGDGAIGEGRDPAHVYTQADTYTVTLTVTGSDGISSEPIVVPITIGPNAPPSATFSLAPENPVAGQAVTFTGGSDPDGDFVTRSWEFGDGTTSTGEAPRHRYANAGDYTVVLTVTDAHGAFDTSNQTVTVAEPPADGSPPVEGGTQTFDQLGGSGLPTNPLVPTPNVTAPGRMRPFPVVRIAGVILPRGARVQILSVRGPRWMQVRVRCRGRGCPVGSMRLTSATRLARLHRFERRLAVGTMLELFVRKPGKVGKYTRFVIRAGEAPARVDRCLVPGRTRPVRCQ